MHIKRLATKGMNISEQEEGSGSPAPHTPCIQATWEIAPPTYQLDNENFSPAATSTQRREVEAFHLQVLLPDIAPAVNVASLIPGGPQSHERSTKQEMPITLCLNIPSRIILRCTQDARKKPTTRANKWATTSIKTSKPTQGQTTCTLKGIPNLNFTTRRTPLLTSPNGKSKQEGKLTAKTPPHSS